jgi:hypothetical protein
MERNRRHEEIWFGMSAYSSEESGRWAGVVAYQWERPNGRTYLAQHYQYRIASWWEPYRFCESPHSIMARSDYTTSTTNALFVWTYQQNQQPSNSVFLSQQTSEQCFQHNKQAKRTGRNTIQRDLLPSINKSHHQRLNQTLSTDRTTQRGEEQISKTMEDQSNYSNHMKAPNKSVCSPSDKTSGLGARVHLRQLPFSSTVSNLVLRAQAWSC